MVFGAKSSSKSKLFEQPLDKLFSPKAIKQLNEALNSPASDPASNPNNTATKSPLSSSLSAPLNTSFWAKLSHDNSPAKRKRAAARLRRFTIDANNNAHILSCLSASNAASTRCGHGPLNQRSTSQQDHHHKQQQQNQLSDDERRRQRLMLSVLPEPIRCLLNELYLRGPNTVGIFRKSPNAKHCRELRQKLESLAAGQSSSELIGEYQVNVIASVFKEWLRSLPDCLLMSRLYPQWIDVAKLIEPLHLDQQQQARLKQQTSSLSSSSSMDDDDAQPAADAAPSAATTTASDKTPPKQPNQRPHSIVYVTSGQQHHSSLRPRVVHATGQQPASLMTDNDDNQPMALTRARSCSTMTSSSCSNDETEEPSDARGARKRRQDKPSASNIDSGFSDSSAASPDHAKQQPQVAKTLSMSEFALRERHSECVRIIGQLFDRLNEANLILLKAIISVLCHIANNSEHNKMSATNLGVCVGQSLLNDEHQPHSSCGNGGLSYGYSQNSPKSNLSQSSLLSSPSGSQPSSSLLAFSAATFARRHRRARSQGGQLSAALSLSSLTQLHSPTSPSHQSSAHQLQLESNSAQETAKYVPILVAFMIDNAHLLFGRDVELLFSSSSSSTEAKENVAPDQPAQGTNESPASRSMDYQPQKDHSLASDESSMPNSNSIRKLQNIDQVDSCTAGNHHAQANTMVVAEDQLSKNTSPRLSENLSAAVDQNSSLQIRNSIFRRQPNVHNARIIRNMSAIAGHNNNNVNHPNNNNSTSGGIFIKSHRRNLSASVLVPNLITLDQQHRGESLTVKPHLEVVTIDTSSSAVDNTHKQSSQQANGELMGSDGDGTTSILIVNSPRKRRVEHDDEGDANSKQQLFSPTCSSSASSACGAASTSPASCSPSGAESPNSTDVPLGHHHQRRPLSASESTNSSSRASSSTSGLHSESPAFSSEPDSSSSMSSHHNQQRGQAQPQHHHRHQFATSSMPKIPFQYTTSCYGGEAILYYPSYSHLAQQQQRQQQIFNQKQRPSSYHPECHRSQSLMSNRHNSPVGHPQQQPQRSHVMLLRDYYLSLQQQQQQQQQQWATYRLKSQQQQQSLNQQHQLPRRHPQQQQQQHLICHNNIESSSAEEESDDCESWMESTMV